MRAPSTTIIPFVTGATMTRHLPQQAAEPHVPDPNQPLVFDPRDPMAIARRLVADKFMVDEQQTLFRYREEFFKFSGSSYRTVDDDTIRAEIWFYLERAVELASCAPFKPKKAIVDNVADALAAICNLERALETPTWLDEGQGRAPANEFLPVANGLLHLPTGQLHPASPLYFAVGSSEVAFDTNAPTPHAFLNFLHDLFGDDLESNELLQDMMGYALGPDTSQQKIMLLVGPPRAGKGTIADILSALVGPSSVAGPTMSSLGQNFGLAPLIGKKLAIIGDARIGGRTDQAVVVERLLSISGEDTHTIDRKFKEPWTGRLRTRFFVLTNELPRLTDSSGALASRFVPLVLTRSFLGAEDHGLKARLQNERSGILNWALAGYRRLRERGRFVQAANGLEATQDLEELASPIKAFVAQRCDLAGEVPCGSLYASWRLWCDENGHIASSAGVFGRDLRAAAPAVKVSHRRAADARSRVYVGINLKPEWEV